MAINQFTVNVITRGGLALSNVLAYELVSAIPAGSVFGFRNMSVDTAAGTGIKILTVIGRFALAARPAVAGGGPRRSEG